MEEKRICLHCGCELEDGERTAYGEGEICENCLENEFSYCDHCGEVIHNDEAYEIINGDFLCRDCVEELTSICDHCGGRVYTSDTVNDEETIICNECYDEYYHRCEGCNRIINENDVNWSNNLPYCDSCYDDIDSDDEIEDYNYKPDPIFYGCGNRFNVNRNAFGDNQSEQEETISKILFFIEKHWSEMFQFSRRNEYNMNRWSARFGFEKTAKEILDKAKSGSNGRYVAVNLNNYHTIRFRLFRDKLQFIFCKRIFLKILFFININPLIHHEKSYLIQ